MPKDRKPLSMAKHVFGAWIAAPFVLGGIGNLIMRAVDAPAGEIATATMFGIVLGVLGGWALGLFVFLMHWGLRGWAVLFEKFREYRRNRKAQATDEAYAITAAAEDAAGPDPWQGLNEYGCCRYNVDDQGYPTHGAQGCRHPQASLYASA